MELKSEQLWSLVQPRLRSYLGQTWDFGLVGLMTGSTVPTVTGWLADQTPPGERLIRLWHMLAAVGLESPELADLPHFNRYCGELLTFDVIDIKELREICNISNAQGVLSVLRGTSPMHPQLSVVELKELHGAELQKRKAVVVPLASPGPGPERTEALGETDMTTVRIGGEDVIVFTASLLGSLLPLVRHFDSEECLPADRSTLRKLVGNDDMFDLSNHLNNLCSERARTHGRTGR